MFVARTNRLDCGARPGSCSSCQGCAAGSLPYRRRQARLGGVWDSIAQIIAPIAQAGINRATQAIQGSGSNPIVYQYVPQQAPVQTSVPIADGISPTTLAIGAAGLGLGVLLMGGR